MRMLIEPKYDFVGFHQSPDYYNVQQAGNTFLLHKFSGEWVYNTDSFNRRLSGKKYSLAFKNDTFRIYDNQSDVIISSLHYKSKRNQFLHYTANQETPVFFIRESKEPFGLLGYFLHSQNIVSHFIISPRGILYWSKNIESEFINGYFKEKKDDKYALFKAKTDSVIQLTGFDYDYLTLPNAFGNITAMNEYDIAENNSGNMESYQVDFIKKFSEGRYSKIHFIDSLGNVFLSASNSSFIRRQSVGYSLPTIENNALLLDTLGGYISPVIFKDTLTVEWPNLDSIFWHTDYYTNGPQLVKKASSNYIIRKKNKQSVVSNGGKKMLPGDYTYLNFLNDTILLFADSSAVGVGSISGKEFLHIDVAGTRGASIVSPYFNYIWVLPNDGSVRRMSFIWTDSGLFEIDSITVAKANYNYFQRERDSLSRVGDLYWSLSNKKISTKYNYESKTYNVYCDSVLINPHMEITEVKTHYDVLFIMKDKQNHTWIYDNNGKIVYNTNEEYEYDVKYSPSGNINHFIITIRNSKNKFVSNIHWPGFNGQPNYSMLPIKRFIDSFTVISSLNDDNKEGLLDKNHNLIIWPNDILEFKKSTNISSPNYLFFSNGFIYDQTGKVLLDEVFYNHSNADSFQLTHYSNNKNLPIFIDKYNSIYTTGVTK
ncbi:MAG: hypothetical protein ACO1PI_03500 [Bacteroidota bacterium]